MLARYGISLLISVVLHALIVEAMQSLNAQKPHKPEIVVEAALIALPKPKSESQRSSPPPLTVPKPENPEQRKKTKPKPVVKPTPKPLPELSRKAEPVEAPVPVLAAPAESAASPESPAPPVLNAIAAETATPNREAATTSMSVDKSSYFDTLQTKYRSSRRVQDWKMQGTTILEVHCLASGTVASVKVSSSSGHDYLDDMAVDALKKARCIPKKLGTTTMDSVVSTKIEFKLKD